MFTELMYETNYRSSKWHKINLFIIPQSGVFTPDLAFEVIVKQQIAQLKGPILNCIEQVIDELSKSIYKCTAKIERYPKLRVEAERLIIERLHQSQKNCQDQLALQIEIELIYMNTKHSDFVRFTK
jgi:dynamin 1/3